MAYKVITLVEQKYTPKFDLDNAKDPFVAHYKPLNKEQSDRYIALVKVSNPKAEGMSYDAAKANKFLWDSSIIKLENVVSETNLTPHTIDSKEDLDFFYQNANPNLIREILEIIYNISGLTEEEIKNSVSAQGSLS